MTGDWRYIAGAAVIGVVVMVIGVRVVWNDSPARGAADRAAVYASQIKPPLAARTRPVEYSPKVGEVVPGDGTWLVGREVKRGTYRAEGGEWCFWERLRNLSGEDNGVMSKGFVNGPQVVAMGPDDVAFSSQGCGQWVMIP